MTIHGQVKTAEMPDVVNFSRIEGKEGFGGATEPSAMGELKKNGFATVINLRHATEPGALIDASRTAAESAGLNYIHLPFSPADADSGLVDDFLAAVSNEANAPVYIHCASATRVAALWMIHRVLEEGWSLDDSEVEATVIAAKPADAIAFASKYIAASKQEESE